MGSDGLPDDERLYMIPPELRADYLRRRAAQLDLRKPSSDREAKKTLARFPVKTPIKNDADSKLSRSGEDVVTSRSDLGSLPGSSSGEETLGLFPLAPIKEIVDLDLSLGCGSGNRKGLEKKMTKKADQELESDGAPIKEIVGLELSLACGSGNRKDLEKKMTKKADQELESDGAPIKEIVDLELSLGCGSGNRKDLEKKMTKKADQELESDGAPIKKGVNLEPWLSR